MTFSIILRSSSVNLQTSPRRLLHSLQLLPQALHVVIFVSCDRRRQLANKNANERIIMSLYVDFLSSYPSTQPPELASSCQTAADCRLWQRCVTPCSVYPTVMCRHQFTSDRPNKWQNVTPVTMQSSLERCSNSGKLRQQLPCTNFIHAISMTTQTAKQKGGPSWIHRLSITPKCMLFKNVQWTVTV